MFIFQCEIYPEAKPNFIERFENNYFVTDNEGEKICFITKLILIKN